jgi:molecular chaperone GrpE
VNEDENISAESEPEPHDPTTNDEAAEIVDEAEQLSEADGLRAELESAKTEVAAARDTVLRAQAEADNVRKRAERDVTAAHKFGLERFIGGLLPVKDSMELGFNALEATTDIEAIREGMALTSKMLDDALEKSGVTTLDPTGEVFDPEFHQAMTMQPSSEAEPGTVLSCMQKGYVLNERLIRPAMVVVAKAVEE